MRQERLQTVYTNRGMGRGGKERQERLQTVYTNRGMGRGGKERQERLQTVYTNRGMGRGENNDRGERDTLEDSNYISRLPEKEEEKCSIAAC